MKTCKTCRFWEFNDSKTFQTILTVNVHYCDLVGYVNGPKRFDIDCNASDDTGLISQFITGPDFGCVNHEEK